ncbi:hypothetical protein GCM10009133_29500 [Cocleimonas flava]|uniref:Rhodanese-related sulfurtransferase n=1 Tax=Cocleimonas flava TaxID=634765 RepID=A0A4V2P9D6_9GAMM|nr:rhodanese-like domain-containing protein [Cocleimonas flava]TCJ89205.1 rhodanese-related sulfurtransferase [Cocleimonas flava]
MNNIKPIVLGGFLLSFLTACNANTNADKSVEIQSTKAANVEKVNTKGADPIPQPGGYSNIDNAKLKELAQQGVLLVDIRRKEEWQQTGIIEGSNTITFFDRTGNINPNFVPEFTALAKPNQPVMLICRTGNRTQAASRAIAEQLGYRNVMNVTNGITGWMAERRPISSFN